MTSNIFDITVDDITRIDNVDAIVNAANPGLAPGGAGTNAAIHRVAGPLLAAECRVLAPCQTGGAKLTAGYNLPVPYVIHTVGPVWRGGGVNEAVLLARCYKSCLAVARYHGLRSIAFPAISTGVYGFPADLAARVATHAVLEAVASDTFWRRIAFVIFDINTARAYVECLGRQVSVAGEEGAGLPVLRNG